MRVVKRFPPIPIRVSRERKRCHDFHRTMFSGESSGRFPRVVMVSGLPVMGPVIRPACEAMPLPLSRSQ